MKRHSLDDDTRLIRDSAGGAIHLLDHGTNSPLCVAFRLRAATARRSKAATRR
jgi:hypothetical protein